MSDKAILLSNLTNHSVQNSKFTAALRAVAFGKHNHILPQFYRNTPAVPYHYFNLVVHRWVDELLLDT